MKLNVQQALVKQDNPTPAHGPLGSGLRPCKVYQREKVQRGAGASLSPTQPPAGSPESGRHPPSYLWASEGRTRPEAAQVTYSPD